MSPHVMDKIRPRFEAACKKLGWEKRERDEPHERDSMVEPTHRTDWHNSAGWWLFHEDMLSPAMAHEIIHIASKLP